MARDVGDGGDAGDAGDAVRRLCGACIAFGAAVRAMSERTRCGFTELNESR
jgi:hypothetical protein